MAYSAGLRDAQQSGGAVVVVFYMMSGSPWDDRIMLE